MTKLIKISTILTLIISMSLIFSSCGLPTEYNFTQEKDYYSSHTSEINELFDVIENNNWKSIYKDHYDEKYHYSIVGDEENLFLADIYPELDQVVSNMELSSISKREDGNIYLSFYHNGWYFKSYKNIEDIECPFNFSGANEEDLAQLKLEKEIDGDKIHFIADHRKDNETYWKHMYYRIDVEKIDTYIYSYELQEKYPWTSIFSV